MGVDTVQQLLASMGVDSVQAVSVSGDLVLLLRDPQPDEEGILIDSDVRLRVVDLAGDVSVSGEGVTSLLVYVDGVLVYEMGGAPFPDPDWQGPDNAEAQSNSSLDVYCWADVTLDQDPNVWTSQQVVSVRVVAGNHLSSTLDETYYFTVQDLTAPQLLTAEGNGRKTVLITFDEAMETSGPNSVLLSEKWEIERLNSDPDPAVELTALSVEEVDGSGGEKFILTLDREQTPGGRYVARVSDVDDISGNGIDLGHDEAEFLGFTPEEVLGRRFSIWDMMVPNKNKMEDDAGTHDLRRMVNCLQEVLDLLLYEVDAFSSQWDPDSATVEQVDWMLYDMGNPFDWYDLDLTSLQKRKLLRLLVPIYQQKGTAAGIENVVRLLLGIETTVVPHSLTGWILGEDELGEGSASTLISGTAEPWDFSGGKTLRLQIDFEPHNLIHFVDGDFANPALATAAEIAAVIQNLIGPSGLDIGEAVDALGYVAIFSSKIGHHSRVETSESTANDLLQFPAEPAHGIGGAELAPGDAWTLYAFDILAETVLSSLETKIIRRIGEYMKAAHEHLVKVTGPVTPYVPDHWSLGESRLGVTTVLHE